MSQKVPCCKCGVPILESTALRTDGLCMPCKGGYRESIDEGKRHVGEQRERMLTDPYRKLWVSLVELVHLSPSGFDGLSHPQKLYFAVNLLDGDVYNGGFHQYFFNNAVSYMLMLKRVSSRSAHSRRLNYCRKPKTYCFLPSPSRSQ